MIVLLLPFLFGFLLLLFFPSLIAVARTSNTVLSKSDKTGHPCLVPDLRGNAFSFSPLSTMATVGLSYIVEVYFLYTHFLESFYHKWMLNFVKSFFCICWDDHMICILQFVNMVYHIDWLVYIEESLHPWDKSHLIIVYDPLMYC